MIDWIIALHLVLLAITLGCVLCVFREVKRGDRIDEVSTFRQQLLEDISRATHRDIAHGKPWEWRYRVFDLVSFGQMCREHEKPLKPEAFWDDTSFLEPTEHNVETSHS